MSEAQFLYGEKEDANAKESYLPTPLRPRSASKSQRSKMMTDNGDAPLVPTSTNLLEATHVVDLLMKGEYLNEIGNGIVEQIPATDEKEGVDGTEVETPSVVVHSAESDDQMDDMKGINEIPQSNGDLSALEKSKAGIEEVEGESQESSKKEAKENAEKEVPTPNEIAEEKEQDSDVEVEDKGKVDKGKAPEKPKVEIYTLPIGGGPKKNIVLPPIRTYTKPKDPVVIASTSRSRYNTKGSRSTSNMRRSVKRGVSLPTIPSIHRKSTSKASVATLGADGKPIAKRSATAPEQETNAKGLVAGTVKAKPRKSKGKARLVYPQRKDVATTGNGLKRSANGQVQRRRIKRNPGQVNSNKRSQHGTFAETTEGDVKQAISSAIQLEDQMLYSNQGDGVKADAKSEISAEEEGDDISFTTAMEEEELDNFDIEIAPVKIYEDDDGVNEAEHAPLGSYATLPPSKARLEKASELTLYDEDGNLVQFGSIFANRRTLICFLRHWLCPFCQMFAKSIQNIDPLPLESANMDLVVVGQGHWHVTKSYKEVMRIPKFVRMYADPNRKVYKMLGMTFRTNDQGPACDRPEYQTMGVFKASMIAMKKGIFDMPLRVPGDLMLLGGEFILGPGPQCSFTHRMETTRGHLDLPKILTQAGCDMSLKSAPGLLEEQNKRPGSTRSFDRKSSKFFTRRLKGGRSSADLGSRKMTSVGKIKSNETSTLNGDESQHERKSSSTSVKRKPPPPLPNVRSHNISYPIKQQQQTDMSPSYADFEDDNVIPITRDIVDRADSDIDHTLPSPYSPLSPSWSPLFSTKPLDVVNERELGGIHSELAKSPSSSDLGHFPRPPVPATSSAAAYVAATARAKAIQRKDQENIMAARKSLGKIYTSRKATESMPTLSNSGASSPMSPLMQVVHTSSSGKGSGVPTADSTYTAMTHRSDDAELSPPNSANPSLLGFHGRSQDKTLDTTVESDFKTISATNPLTRSGSNKRQGFVSTAGVPMSVFEKLANAGSPKRATFSSSSPSLPLGDSTFVDASSTPFRTPTTPRTEDGFGEDTEYKRLDRKALENPSSDDLKGQTILYQNERSGMPRPIPSKEHLNKPLPPLLASLENSNSIQNEQRSRDEDEDLQKTPKARTFSLDSENFKSKRETFGQSNGQYVPSQEIASPTAAHIPNRASVIAADLTVSSFDGSALKITSSDVKPSSSSTAFSNPLLASLPPLPAPTVPPPPAPPISAKHNAVSSRAPIPATNPLFASILAEEAARRDNIHNNASLPSSKVTEKPASALSEWKQFKQSPVVAVTPSTAPVAPIKKKAAGKTFGSSSFLDDLDVHDNLQSSKLSPNLGYSPSIGVSESAVSDYGNEEEEEEEEDDWAPLQASKNVIPAGIREQDAEPSGDDRTDASISDLSTGEEDYEDDDDDEDMSPAVQRYRGFMPTPINRSQKKYVLKQVTGRPSPASSRPRKVELKTSSRRLYQPPSLNAFKEEEEDQSTPRKEPLNPDVVHAH